MSKEQSQTVITAPERIWLQVGDQEHYHREPFPRDTGEVTWCSDSVAGCEVPYVRADLAITIPNGWKLVPEDPTFEMVSSCDARFIPRIALPVFVAAYKTMLAAAPEYKP